MKQKQKQQQWFFDSAFLGCGSIYSILIGKYQCSFELSAPDYQATWCHSPEESTLHSWHCADFKYQLQCCFLLVQLFQVDDFLNLSESMVQMIMCRNLDVPEVCKFEAMLGWARNKIRTKASSKMDSKLEFKCIMERLARDLKLYRISPQELIKVCQFGVFVQEY